MSQGHYNFTPKHIGIFTGLVLLTTIAVTFLYGLIYGFNTLGQDLAGASKMMTAAFNRPAMTGPQTAFPGHTFGQRYQAAAPFAQHGFPQARHMPAGAGQYLCPQHGAAGLPQHDANGTPRCPLDGQPMWFNNIANQTGP